MGQSKKTPKTDDRRHHHHDRSSAGEPGEGGNPIRGATTRGSTAQDSMGQSGSNNNAAAQAENNLRRGTVLGR